MRSLITLALTLALATCGGERRVDPPTEPTEESESRSSPAPAEPPTDESVATEALEVELPDFEIELPTEGCHETRVALAHRDRPALPPALTGGLARRSEDGRTLEVALADAPIVVDARGRFEAPGPGGARLELDALRNRRRGSLEPGVLGPPTSRHQGLSHVRIVTDGPLLTFGHREIGRVELMVVDEAQVCGVIDLDDGRARARGPFTAQVVGSLPE